MIPSSSANIGDNRFDSSVDALDEAEGIELDAGQGIFDDPANGLDDSFDQMVFEYKKGERVEALFRNGQKYYTCTIKSCDEDGTYSLVYDDGDEERGVPESNIRRYANMN